MDVCSQKSASVQRRTSPPKFVKFVEIQTQKMQNSAERSAQNGPGGSGSSHPSGRQSRRLRRGAAAPQAVADVEGHNWSDWAIYTQSLRLGGEGGPGDTGCWELLAPKCIFRPKKLVKNVMLFFEARIS